MHPFFSVTLFTGQQLVLEALQRWLARPCPDAVSQARRRLGLKQLISLLLRTAATGVLATVLDAAIEFRRRQLLAAATAEPAEEGAAGGAAVASRFPGLGMLSRAGVAAWKSRLLLAIDELERRAGEYGIESRHRFSPTKDAPQPAEPATSKLPRHPAAGSCIDLAGAGAEPECSEHLGRTVEQLRELVQQRDPESQRRLDLEVGSLVDLILGTCPSAPATPSGAPSASGSAAYGCGGAAAATAAGRCRSVPAALDGLWADGAAEELCAICMDRPVTVQVAGCSHDLCFSCARRLCASHDHLVPQCPFCRQAIEGFVARPLPAQGRPAAPAAVRAHA
ncbi:hypothetical protein ABPG75_011466 [Micractinium tetrahymenae]